MLSVCQVQQQTVKKLNLYLTPVMTRRLFWMPTQADVALPLSHEIRPVATSAPRNPRVRLLVLVLSVPPTIQMLLTT